MLTAFPFAPVHMLTGEEDEFTQYQIPRAKLFVLEGTDWKERGVGQLRLNTKTSLADDKMSARMVMRSEAVHRLILNISLFAEMNVTLAQDKFLRFSAFEDGKLHHFTVRCANPVIGTELYEHVEELKHMLPKTMSSQEKASADKTDRPVQDA
jgi:Ran-binding protein 3